MRAERRLLVEADADGFIYKTHQQLASDVGSVREVISRLLGECADIGLVEIRRAERKVVNREKQAELMSEPDVPCLCGDP
jgi:CRP/FNR family transcriptional regulator